mmetsp:Transcript_34969/g.84642  ORF Transcript_34969/g.84642 Transcript_34969/m.84642 type:complete len:238 (+) Transcript_34969:208-921(+)
MSTAASLSIVTASPSTATIVISIAISAASPIVVIPWALVFFARGSGPSTRSIIITWSLRVRLIVVVSPRVFVSRMLSFIRICFHGAIGMIGTVIMIRSIVSLFSLLGGFLAWSSLRPFVFTDDSSIFGIGFFFCLFNFFSLDIFGIFLFNLLFVFFFFNRRFAFLFCSSHFCGICFASRILWITFLFLLLFRLVGIFLLFGSLSCLGCLAVLRFLHSTFLQGAFLVAFSFGSIFGCF